MHDLEKKINLTVANPLYEVVCEMKELSDDEDFQKKLEEQHDAVNSALNDLTALLDEV